MASEARRPFLSFLTTSAVQGPQPLAVQLPKLWKAMILTSFLLNLVLFAIIVFLAGFVLQNRGSIGTTTQGVASNVQELQDVVVQLQEARIKTTIALDQQLPINLIVPIDTTTTVTTTAPVPLSVPADIDLGPFGRLNPNVNLALPTGTSLNIALKLNVPLNTSIPVQLDAGRYPAERDRAGAAVPAPGRGAKPAALVDRAADRRADPRVAAGPAAGRGAIATRQVEDRG